MTSLNSNILTQQNFPKICHECNNHGVPYDCSSIMHYGAESFSRTGQWTMKAKSKVNQVSGIFSRIFDE